MDHKINITEKVSLDTNALQQLADMLIRVVEEGASIGFLAPVSPEEAAGYWEQVIEPGVILFTAEQEGSIVGTVQLHPAMKRNASHRAEIVKLMVDPGRRKQGIARQLMQAAERKAADLGRTLLILDTRAGDPSNKLYLSMGYVEAGRIPEFARSSNGSLDDTVIYYKRLAE